ncbi:hypothetical protein [Streptomyces exfoliatus]|uniref:hypothetical protein n=1 Tax=Streptomyces exfoliatus TaxID=1905 RepID=UPI0004CB8C03|nr:hypothetical protein [Streptomyces exfoliatus]
MYKRAELGPLGEIHNLVRRATRAAAEAAQKNPRAPRAQTNTPAVNRFESDVQRATADPGWELKPFAAITGQGPTAMTRALFYNVLENDPIEMSLPELREALPEPVVAPRATDAAPAGEGDEPAATVAWLNSWPNAWDPYLVAVGLSVLVEERECSPEWHYEGKILARGAGRLFWLYERLAPVIGVREAVLAVVAAAPMLVRPVEPGSSTGSARCSSPRPSRRQATRRATPRTSDSAAGESSPSRLRGVSASCGRTWASLGSGSGGTGRHSVSSYAGAGPSAQPEGGVQRMLHGP